MNIKINVKLLLIFFLPVIYIDIHSQENITSIATVQEVNQFYINFKKAEYEFEQKSLQLDDIHEALQLKEKKWLEYNILKNKLNDMQLSIHNKLINLEKNLPSLFKIIINNNSDFFLLDGYWYIQNYFYGKIQENHTLLNLNYEDYKIHLMPKKEDLESTIIKLILTAKQEPELLKLIANIKFIKNFESYHQNADYNMPIIVIYASSGKQSAQKLLNKIYELFKDQEGSNIKPRWNEKVTSLIYFAQGNGDQKLSIRYIKYFEEGDDEGNGRVYFKSDVTGNHVNYHLQNPCILY